ncbi:glycosyltransferase family 2 protein [Polynucleobacter paneuropaeus]|nr:glycosyltransferase family 2 protein [Polynucleobacter paneuropaeus]
MISVCIPAYESPELFERTLISVLNQKGCDLEVIVTDDSITNDVSAVVERYQKQYQIRYFRNENRLGAVNNWNKSLSLANGEVKKILHHDDWFVDEYSLVEMCMPILEKRADIVFSNCLAMAKEAIIFTHKIDSKKMDDLKIHPENLVFGNSIGAPSVMALSSKINVSFNPHFLWLSDIDFYIRAIRASKLGIALVERPLICITTDGAGQISRECEANKSRSIYEFIKLANQESKHLKNKKDVKLYISSLAFSLSLFELLALIKETLLKGEYFVIKYTYPTIFRKIFQR